MNTDAQEMVAKVEVSFALMHTGHDGLPSHPTGQCPRCQSELALVNLYAELVNARNLVSHMFQMISAETWREHGGDDGQGHYEGDYHAAQLQEQILGWQQ